MKAVLSFTALLICSWISGGEPFEFVSGSPKMTTSAWLSDVLVYRQYAQSAWTSDSPKRVVGGKS
jgi:hypothetical protein